MTILIQGTNRTNIERDGEPTQILVHHYTPGTLLIRSQGNAAPFAVEITEEEGRRLAAYLAPKAVDTETGQPVQVGVVLEPQPSE